MQASCLRSPIRRLKMQRNSAYFLFLAVLAMLVIGVVMLFSTSAFAHDAHGDVYFFIKRQSLWLGIGLAVLIAAALVDYHFWYHTWWLWFLLALGTLALCFVPHFGLRINGSRRWVGAGPITFQPSEIAKIAAVFFLAWWFARFEGRTRNLIFSFVLPLVATGLLVSLIITEVDLGTSALIGATTFVMMFVAGTNAILLGVFSASALGGFIFTATCMPERMSRLLAFLHPENYKQDAGLQQMQALIAWGSGGMEGLGLGNGRQKMLYLPYAHTDFIFPMIGEELGLRVSCGIISMLGLQAAVNIGVTTSLLPNKGLPLPFISYGGSNLVACLFGVGLLLNIYRQAVLEPANKKRTSLQVRLTPRI